MRDFAGKPPTGAATATSDSGEAMRTALERQMEEPFVGPAKGPPPPVPDHVLLHRIGAGAYGDVWLARSALGTLRAVKVVYRDRFEDERPYLREFHGILKYEPVSRSHEGLVAVLHVGRNDDAGCFYYVMELADDANVSSAIANREAGPRRTPQVEEADQTSAATPPSYTPRTLRAELARRERLPPAEAAQLALLVAGGLAHLHAHGLVHRDVKPSNVIFVGGTPKLADIGLVTGAGDSRSFVGTEGYIPPEGPGTAQGDLYGLGKLLYELATGRDRLDFPQLPPALNKLPEGEAILELNEIITRACAPDPRERYAAATELIADLNLFLAGRSLRQVRKIERHLTWLKRFALAGCLVMVLAAGAVWLAKAEARRAHEREQVSQQRAQAEAALRQRAEAAEHEQSSLREEAQAARANEARLRKQAEAQELAARKKAYASDMNLLQQALAADDLARAQELLERQRPQPGQQDLRGWEWRYFWQFCQSDAAFTLCQRSNSIVSVSFSRDGSLLAAGTWGGEVTVWDVAQRRMILETESDVGRGSRLAFAPDSDVLAYYSQSNDWHSLVIWDSNQRREIRRLPLQGELRDLAFTRDGKLFTAEHGWSNNVTRWDVNSGTALNHFSANLADYGMGTVFNIAPDGSRFAQAIDGASHSVRIADTAGILDATLRVTDELTTAMAFSPDGRTLASGGGYADGVVKLWNLDTRELIDTLEGHRSWVSCLKVLSDGKTLASASADRTIRLWDLKTRQPLRTLRGQRGELWTLDASPDGHWLASGCKDGSVFLWDLHSSTNRPPLFRVLEQSHWSWCQFSPDGRLFGALRQPGLELYDTRTLKLTSEPGFPVTNLFSFAFSPDMRLLVTADANGRLSVWDVPARILLTNFAAHPAPNLLAITFIKNGTRLVTLGAQRVVKLWDVPTWTEVLHWSLPSSFISTSVSRRAGVLAAASGDGDFELIPFEHPEVRTRFTGETRMSGVALAPDGKLLAGSSENGTLEIWRTDPPVREALLHGVLLGYHSVVFSPDGERLAAGSNGQEAVKLWDPHSHEELATLPGRGSFFSSLKFSPDGNMIVARNWNGVIHFWTAPSWKDIEGAEKTRRL